MRIYRIKQAPPLKTYGQKWMKQNLKRAATLGGNQFKSPKKPSRGK